MSYNISKEILELLNIKIQTEKNYLNAKNYLLTNRKLKIETFKEKPYLTENLSRFVELNSSIFKHDWLSESLFFPIVEFNPNDTSNNIIGYDVRYIGKNKDRTRYYKIKAEGSRLFNYNAKDIFNKNDTVYVCEGIIDLETLNSILKKQNKNNYSIISPLTCLTNVDYIKLLLYSFKNVIIVYDNDTPGMNAKSKLKAFKTSEKLSNLHFFNYLGKDINDSYKTLGEYSILNGVQEIDFEMSKNKFIKVYK